MSSSDANQVPGGDNLQPTGSAPTPSQNSMQGIENTATFTSRAAIGVSRREQELEIALDKTNRENARLKKKLAFLLAGNAETDSLRNRAICNITYQNISLESREQLEKLLYRISGSRDVLDTHRTWKIGRSIQANSSSTSTSREMATDNQEDQEQSLESELRLSPASSIDYAKRRGYSGSVQYYYDFTLDTSAWPSPDVRRLDVHLWPEPYYSVDSDEVLSGAPKVSGDNGSGKKGAGNGCFNCGSTAHPLSACPKPKDQERIRRAINEWKRSRLYGDDGGDVRYHNASAARGLAQVTPSPASGPHPSPSGSSPSPMLKTSSASSIPISHAQPGVLSERLRQALGIFPEQNPPYYRNFVYYGYPPSYYRVPKEPVKFIWVESGSTVTSNATSTSASANGTSSSQLQQNGVGQPSGDGLTTSSEQKKRVRTVSYPGLAAPLYDLSYFFDLYHPIEDVSTTPSTTSSSILGSSTSNPKYNVTTVVSDEPRPPTKYHVSTTIQIDDDDVVIVESSRLTEDAAKTKKRPRPDGIEDPSLPSGPLEKHPKIIDLDQEERDKEAEIETKQAQHEKEADEWVDRLLAKLDEKRHTSVSDEGNLVEDDAIEPIVPLDQVSSRLPQGSGLITHNLTDRELSTHGALVESTGVWQRLRTIIDSRPKDS